MLLLHLHGQHLGYHSVPTVWWKLNGKYCLYILLGALYVYLGERYWNERVLEGNILARSTHVVEGLSRCHHAVY